MKVATYALKGSADAQVVMPLLAQGARVVGDEVVTYRVSQFSPHQVSEFDVAVIWGYVTACQTIIKAYAAAKKPFVYLDLAYWHRLNSYKVCVNARHPNAYFQRVKHQPDRFHSFKIEPQPFMDCGMAILIAGMSEKSAWAEGFEPMSSWEQGVVETLKRYTNRPLVYRPKRPWAANLQGTEYNSPKTSLKDTLVKTFAVVTHHSNVAVDGLVAGVPVFVWEGAAVPLGSKDLSKIETPYFPGPRRDQWLYDLAYCQWSKRELQDGTCWRHLKDEGLIP